jgi:hypothetical protein
MQRRWFRFGAALGFAVICTATVVLFQSRFKAGSLPDLFCELVLLPGKLIAVLFRDRGDASPEFLWPTYTATVVVWTAAAWLVLRWRSGRAARNL